MNNITFRMFLFQAEQDVFEHPAQVKITISILTILILISTVIISRRLFGFLRRPNRRCLDDIVYIQQLVQFGVTMFVVSTFNIIIWRKVPKDHVTEIGCYFGTYFFYFLAPYTNIHSFFISLFRYICILHPNFLAKRNISPEVRYYRKYIHLLG